MNTPYKFPDYTPIDGHHLVRLMLSPSLSYWVEAEWDAAEKAWFDPLDNEPIEEPVSHFMPLPVVDVPTGDHMTAEEVAEWAESTRSEILKYSPTA